MNNRRLDAEAYECPFGFWENKWLFEGILTREFSIIRSVIDPPKSKNVFVKEDKILINFTNYAMIDTHKHVVCLFFK